MNKRTISTIALAFAAAAAACGRNDNKAADTTLNRDLSLAAQANQPFDSLSAAERTAQSNALNAPAAPTTTSSSRRAASRTTTTRRSTGSGEVVRSSSSGTRTTTSSGTVVKHTKRDAAIGAAAGAVIGATTSRNKVKGGIIGNNVDKTKKKP